MNWHITVAASGEDGEDLAVVMSADVLAMALNTCITLYGVDPQSSVSVSSTALATIRQVK